MTNKLTVSANSKRALEGITVQETFDLNIGEGAVIGVSSRSAVENVEAFAGELRVALHTVFTVQYSSGGEVQVKEIKVDNIHPVPATGVTAMTKSMLSARVIDCEYSFGVSVKGKASIEIGGWHLSENSLELLDAENDSICVRRDSTTVENVSLLKEIKIAVTNSDQTRLPLSRVLDASATASVSNVYPSSGQCQVEGELNLRLVALTDNNQFLTQNFTHPFSCEIMDESITAQSTVDMEPMVKSVLCTISDGDTRTVISDVVVSLKGNAAFRTDVKGIVDAYSTTHELILTKSTAVLNGGFCYRQAREKASGIVALNGSANEILFAGAPNVNVTLTVGESTVTVEGLISATVGYIDDAGQNKCVPAEIPYRANIAKEYACDEFFRPDVSVLSFNARLRSGNEIEINAEIAVNLRGAVKHEFSMISSIETGAAKEDDDVAISVIFAREGDTLFDAARELNCREEEMLAQNPELVAPFKGGEQILLYREMRQ